MTPNPVKRKLKEGSEPPHREFEEAIQVILRAAQKHGIGPGIHCARPETVNRRIAEGWRLAGCTSDIYHLSAGARAARAVIKTE